MIKAIRRVLFGSISILGLSFFIWIVLMLNPKFMYSHSTIVDNVTVYHNSPLDSNTDNVIKDAIEIASSSAIYNDQLQISLCMNDHSFYPELYPFAGGTAYAFINKTVIYRCNPNFLENTAEFAWDINNFEKRKYNLTKLLAHEFMHNFQFDFNTKYHITSTLGNINWKFEGHADYIARGFKNDGQLLNKIDHYLYQEKREHTGVAVFITEDGTIQNLSYYKFSLVIQYLMEEQGLSFGEICKLEASFDELYEEMLAWSQTKN